MRAHVCTQPCMVLKSLSVQKEPKSKLEKTEEAKSTMKKLSMACSLNAWLCGRVSVFRRYKGIVRL